MKSADENASGNGNEHENENAGKSLRVARSIAIDCVQINYVTICDRIGKLFSIDKQNQLKEDKRAKQKKGKKWRKSRRIEKAIVEFC